MHALPVHALVLGDRFEVRHRLGAGGMGIVYEALDRERNQVVALKTLSHADPKSIYYLKNEFRALVDVVHPNLVGLHELFAEDDTWYFTMELVEGTPFVHGVRTGGADSNTATIEASAVAETMAASGIEQAADVLVSSSGNWFDEPELRSLMLQLVNGVQAIHDAGKLHRDLKPSNVLVTRDGRVKILDFGLISDVAPEAAGQTIGGSIEGTPLYMAPEQARGDKATAASDWYAVGVMLYEAMTGRLPFLGPMADVLVAKQTREPERPRTLNENVPLDLDELCVGLLKRDAKDRPDGPSILRRLGTHSGSSSRSPSVSSLSVDTSSRSVDSAARRESGLPFVGRLQELEALEGALDDTLEGCPALVRVQGRSGMGKSALMRQFIDRAREQHGAVVLSGRCYERESVPYKGIDGLIDALTRHLRKLPPRESVRVIPRNVHLLARLFPVLLRVEAIAGAPNRRAPPVDPRELRRRALGALADLLGGMADVAPLVLVIDDFQWADRDSVLLLRELLTQSEPPACLFLISYRAEEAERSDSLVLLTEVLAESDIDARSVEVGPLDADEVSELGRRLLGKGTRLNLQTVFMESQGNPYFVHELLRQVQQSGNSDEPPPSTGAHLDDVLRRRIACLPEAERHLLEFVAVAGRPTSADVLRTVVEIDDETQSLRKLRADHLIRTSGRRGTFVEAYHDRIREAVVGGLPAERLVMLHARLAAALELHRAEPQTLVEHYRASGNKERVFEHAQAAAQRATEALAFDRAARFYRVAIEFAPGDRLEMTAVLKRRLADVLATGGRSLEAAEAYEQAAALVGGGEAARLRAHAAAQKLLACRLEEGIAGVTNSIAAYGVELPRDMYAQHRAFVETLRDVRRCASERIAAPAWRSEAELSLTERSRLDVMHAGPLGLYALDLSPLLSLLSALDVRASLEAGEPVRCLGALGLLTSLISASGRRPHVELLTVIGLAQEEAGGAVAQAWRHFNKGCAAYWAFDPPAAVEELLEAERIFAAHCHGVTRELSIVRLKLAYQLLFAGRLSEQARCCDEWRRDARERGDAFTEMWMGLLSVKHLCADDVEAAQSEKESAIALLQNVAGDHAASSMVAVAHVVGAAALADVDLYSGRGASAYERLDAIWAEWGSAMGFVGIPLHRTLANLFASRALASMTTTDQWSPALEARAKNTIDELFRANAALAAGMALTLRAALARRDGDRSEGVSNLRMAVERYATCNPVWAACASRRLGVLLGDAEGDALVRAADERLRDAGVVNPERFARMIVPVS